MCKSEQLYQATEASKIVWGIQVVKPGQEFHEGEHFTASPSEAIETAKYKSEDCPEATVVLYLGTCAKRYVRKTFKAGEDIQDNTSMPEDLFEKVKASRQEYVSKHGLDKFSANFLQVAHIMWRLA